MTGREWADRLAALGRAVREGDEAAIARGEASLASNGALVALTGFRAKGTRQVGNTHLMTAARICLGIFLVILILIALGVFK